MIGSLLSVEKEAAVSSGYFYPEGWKEPFPFPPGCYAQRRSVGVHNHCVNNAGMFLDIFDCRENGEVIFGHESFFTDTGQLVYEHSCAPFNLFLENTFLMRKSDHSQRGDGEHKNENKSAGNLIPDAHGRNKKRDFCVGV
jgi:hypothetical protein